MNLFLKMVHIYTDFLLLPKTLLMSLAMDFEPLYRRRSDLYFRCSITWRISQVKRLAISWYPSEAETSWKWHLFSSARERPSSASTWRAWHKSCLFPTRQIGTSVSLQKTNNQPVLLQFIICFFGLRMWNTSLPWEIFRRNSVKGV